MNADIFYCVALVALLIGFLARKFKCLKER